MFKLSEIKELIKLVDQTSVQELEIENEGARLHIRKPGKTEVVNVQAAPITHTYSQVPYGAAPAETSPQAAAAPQQAAQEAPSAPAKPAQDLHQITSPMVGTFYSSPSPDAAAFVKAGDRVQEKSVVCILEAMKLMNELEAEVSGEIVEILVANGQLVEYGQPLFLVKAD
ncbi:acetyl-CoA carboxylase biotin carboxyl carrier protein [Paenibacillus sp. HB172176]|uniref:acetyl-CoA carboxylase biotin carboxyl carrier protein n=1 Tax=Paenibacillus sp. HB172176 TaxID=2493690 RepID=UPI00143AAA99|nr:acetyl-CoA carboxylase biotin carboxyl carrier protein [Paenibacillus sp. HB172176]